jgi:CAP-Gly domain-containing linker protein 1
MSTATNESSLLSLSRPATPSVRSYSRQSFASSISRLSNHSFLDDAEESRRLAEDLRETTEREKEVRKLLEGSERLGREMEDKLADKDDEIKSLYKKLRGVEEEREVDRAAEAQRVAGLGDEEVEKDRERSRVGLLEARIVELEMKESEMATTATRISSESESKLAARERELEGLRERMEATAQEVAEEQLDLKRQIDNLRSAGQALCETYEERIADIETSRLEALEVVDALTAEIARTASSHDLGSANSSPSDRYSTRSDTTGHTSAADVIDAENEKADLEHLRAKVENLEELLEETKMHLEAEVEDTKRRRQKSGEVELVLKKEIKTLKETIGAFNSLFPSVYCTD